ncbi:twin-arginine translocase subunit TatC [Halomarina litorea]|uniref:twin-arginine translocase subunit TatC n=1 Tax=Halomarina litorea TaxID=2961595 RepID=UPI0020C52190|nr:twin-arginine translocase subunit TatC [Halomarina sp. BCD28]
MSGAIDDGTKRAIADGRAAVGEVLRAAQSHLQKVALVFLFGLLGTIFYLYYFGWARLRADLISHTEAGIIAVTPFDVILLQAKIGMIVGAILSLPVLIYFSRDALRQRGWWPAEKVPTWQLVFLGGMALVLFLLGIAYGYYVFFPVMFEFLASNATTSGFTPTYSIVKWAEFVLFLTLSFGLAAQLPLVMSALAFADIVPYETFRDNWRYAVVAIFVFGALFSPPDPFTQIMWAVPLLVLYWLSLGLAKFVVTTKRGSAEVDFRAQMRENWYVFAGTFTATFGVVYAAIAYGGGTYFNEQVRPLFPAGYQPPVLPRIEDLWGLPRLEAIFATAVVAGLGMVLVVMVYYVYLCLQAASRMVAAADRAERARFGDPTAIDVDELDAAGVRAAPDEVFAAMSEDDSLAHARTAMAAGDHEKAQAILDRFDTAQTAADAEDADADVEEATAETAFEEGDETDEDESGLFTRTTAGMVDSFTEDETTEEDIGGYLYDLQFILGSLTSKSFRLIAVFMTVLAVTFGWLYAGGIGDIKRDFLGRLPTAVTASSGPLVPTNPLAGGLGPLDPGFVYRLEQTVTPQSVDIVTLHPVEALVFEVKVSTIVAAVAVIPLLLYYAWPALKQRGLVGGDRNVLFFWAATTFVALALGSAVGYAVVAPTVISWLAADVVNNAMLIKYQINGFGWLVFFTTVGVGLLATIPSTMLLFHRGGLVPYATMRARWREFTVAVMLAAAVLSPRGVFTMFLFGLPVVFAYGLGLGLLWVYTLGGRRTPRSAGQRAD